VSPSAARRPICNDESRHSSTTTNVRPCSIDIDTEQGRCDSESQSDVDSDTDDDDDSSSSESESSNTSSRASITLPKDQYHVSHLDPDELEAKVEALENDIGLNDSSIFDEDLAEFEQSEESSI
jgi:hypothetical protein